MTPARRAPRARTAATPAQEHVAHGAPAGAPPPGTLSVVATPIGNLADLSPRAAAAIAGADVIVCEDTRRTRALLAHLGIPAGRRLVSCHAHNEAARAGEITDMVASGRQVALVTDAGTPVVSDPGARVVAAVAAAGLRVVTVPGPSAAIAALCVSAMASDRFRFEGFLPRKGKERRARIEAVATSMDTVVLYESPRRLAPTLADLAAACGGGRGVALCRELTKLHEEVVRTDLDGAHAWAEAREVRGEVVIVVAGAEGSGVRASSIPGEREIRDAYAARRAAGVTAKGAVAEVAVELGVSRRRVYALTRTTTGDPAGLPA